MCALFVRHCLDHLAIGSLPYRKNRRPSVGNPQAGEGKGGAGAGDYVRTAPSPRRKPDREKMARRVQALSCRSTRRGAVPLAEGIIGGAILGQSDRGSAEFLEFLEVLQRELRTFRVTGKIGGRGVGIYRTQERARTREVRRDDHKKGPEPRRTPAP